MTPCLPIVCKRGKRQSGEIVGKVSSVLGISVDQFYSPSRNRRGALGRAVAGYLARRLGGHQIKRVAEHFDRDPVVISQFNYA